MAEQTALEAILRYREHWSSDDFFMIEFLALTNITGLGWQTLERQVTGHGSTPGLRLYGLTGVMGSRIRMDRSVNSLNSRRLIRSPQLASAQIKVLGCQV